jgi:hypothetical protein
MMKWIWLFFSLPVTNLSQHDSGGQIILKQSSIIIIWFYQEMVGWISRILIGAMGGVMEDSGSDVRQVELDFPNLPATNLS